MAGKKMMEEGIEKRIRTMVANRLDEIEPLLNEASRRCDQDLSTSC